MRMFVGLAALLLGACAPAQEPPDPAADKPVLGLVTSLPLVFSSNFSLEGGSQLVTALEQTYEVRAIGASDAASLADIDLLFMAHALPQTAENLVALDEWVRGGGKVLMLADPRLDWDVGLPLGHPQAPPYFFGDTGLLGHWGLTLEGPIEDEEVTGPGLSGVGRLSSVGEGCRIEAGGLMAHCALGSGEAIVIADADFLAPDDEAAIDVVTGALAELDR